MRLSTCFLLLISSFLFSQKLSVTYSTISQTELGLQHYKPQIMVLDFVDNQSIFRELIDKNGDSLKMNNGHSLNSNGFENQYYIKKDLLNNKAEKIITNGEMNFSLLIDEKLNWNILPEKKKITIYNVQKATVNYGGRDWTAWFTPDIPISDGPYIFCGLPGLILTLEDDKSQYSFNVVEIKKNNGELFDARKKAISIDWNQFHQLALSYYDHPNRELENRLSSGKSYVTDAEGKRINLDIKLMNKDQQDYIRKNNNPIELNHKTEYQW